MRLNVISGCLVLVLAAPCLAQAGVLYGNDVSLDQLGAIDRTTAAWTLIGSNGPSTGALTGLAYDSNQNVLYGCDPANSSIYTVNQTTGLATLIGPTGFGNINGLAFDPNNNVLYCASLSTNSLFTVNVATGAGTLVALITGASSIEGLAFDPATNTLYGLDDAVNKVVIINTATAVAIQLPNTLSSTGLWRGLDWDSELGVIWASKVNSGQLYQVNPSTGTSTLVGSIPTFVQGLAFKPMAEYQVNQPGASFSINGIQGTAQSFALVNLVAGQAATVSLSSINQGQLWDVGVGVAPLVSRSMGALLTVDDQLVNLDLTDPALALLYQFQSPPFANATFPVVFPVPGVLSIQMAVVDPSSPVGLAFSQPVRIIVQ